ncbi:MAG TPA: VOC family protein [candidate division Zixibacteria bacterium]|nr:VOC family protein [candidate division Zixibacteria bacterium]
MPKLSRILETALYAVDMAAAEKFYSDVLELPLLTKEPGRSLAYMVGVDMLLIFYAPESLKKTNLPAHGASGPGHVAFEIDENEYETWKEHLTGSNVVIEKEVTWKSSARSLYFRDPSDNVLEIATPGVWKAVK